MGRSDVPGVGVLERVLVLVGGPRDAEVTRKLLQSEGVVAEICSSGRDLCAKLEEGAAAALLAEEVLTPDAIEQLARALRRQPEWSDFPMVVFGSTSEAANQETDDVVRSLGNVTVLDRPVRTRSMIASVHAAIRSRRRQYDARRAIESRDAFLAMLGHELRNPLGAIRLAVALMDRRADDGPRPKELGVIERQSGHLARLVDDLLDVARVTHGKVVLKRARHDLVEVARSAFEALDARAREHSLSYELRVSCDCVWVDADRHRLEQVFANLLTNALKYTPPGGSVVVDVRREGGTAIVVVTDTGVGIAPDMLDSVFETFTQADRTLDRTQGGLGLGLALVRSVVHLHGGTVEAASEGPGRGSSFVVRLPAAENVIPAERASVSGPEVAPCRKRVLVVDDSADIRELLAELLEQEGHDVSAANDGPEGLEKILATEPDIAFVDIGLPGFDGFELARRARASGSRTRLVAVTGYGQPEDRRHASDAGFDEHLTKPVVEAELRRSLRRL